MSTLVLDTGLSWLHPLYHQNSVFPCGKIGYFPHGFSIGFGYVDVVKTNFVVWNTALLSRCKVALAWLRCRPCGVAMQYGLSASNLHSEVIAAPIM